MNDYQEQISILCRDFATKQRGSPAAEDESNLSWSWSNQTMSGLNKSRPSFRTNCLHSACHQVRNEFWITLIVILNSQTQSSWADDAYPCPLLILDWPIFQVCSEKIRALCWNKWVHWHLLSFVHRQEWCLLSTPTLSILVKNKPSFQHLSCPWVSSWKQISLRMKTESIMKNWIK